ncbi:MAG TPA: MOSC N-terminal beta barrel domain-containing protein [Alphaproteobacteria bacterium]|nr:MOSC N-terminal beta barrel domain-containing protein [Alphaproteobacteria bacterium]
MQPNLVDIYRYPVKGLSAEALERVTLEPGKRLPGDRRFAIAHGGGMNLGPSADWQQRDAFLMLARYERLALLESHLDAASAVLTLTRNGKQVVRGDLRTALGRTLVEQFLAAFMNAESRGAPKIVESREGGFTDVSQPWISIVNLASVRDLGSRILRASVDPIRFRANLYLDGLAPWRELDWVGRELTVGAVRLRVSERIQRCVATNVNPQTASRDLNIPRALTTGVGHCDMGIFAEAMNAGEIIRGDEVSVPDD